MNAVMLSIRPKWCELIANGKKTIEVRKTRPKLETPFKCYIYCTLPKKVLRYVFGPEDYEGIFPPEQISDKKVFCKIPDGSSPFCSEPYRGSVIGEFVCDNIAMSITGQNNEPPYWGLVDDSCLTRKELVLYGKNKTLYGWHISALQIYDKPRELGEFHFPPEKYCEKELCGGCPKDQVADVNGEYEFDCEWERPIIRAPQSWCYVEELK